MNKLFPSTNDTIKGTLLIIIGIILILHTLGWIRRGLDIIIIVTAILMIFYGILLVSKQNAIKAYIQKMKGCITKK